MSVKGALLALYTLGVGCLLLYSASVVGVALGLLLITIVTAAVVTAALQRRRRESPSDLAW